MKKHKELNKLFLVSLVCVFLFGAYAALGAEWKQPTVQFPDGNTAAPVDIGTTGSQSRPALIDFNVVGATTGPRLILGGSDFLGSTVGNSVLSFLSGSPIFSSDKPLNINAAGIVVPSFFGSGSAPTGTLALDSGDNTLKVNTNGSTNGWSTVGGGTNSLWAQNAQAGIKYENGAVTVGSYSSPATLTVQGDVQIGESSVAGAATYIPVYNTNVKRIPTYLFSVVSTDADDVRLYNFTFEGTPSGYVPANDRENRLACDLDDTKLDCLGKYETSSNAGAKEILYDVAKITQAADGFPTPGFVKMKYQKRADEYEYVAIEDKPISPFNSGDFFPRAYCDQHIAGVNKIYNGTGGRINSGGERGGGTGNRGGNTGPYTEGIECAQSLVGTGSRSRGTNSISGTNDGWPEVIYDRYYSSEPMVWFDFGFFQLKTNYGAIKFERRYIGSQNNAVPGGQVMFSPNVTKTSERAYIAPGNNGSVDQTIEIGSYSYCALSYQLIDANSRSYCEVYYRPALNVASPGIWILKYGKWQDAGVGCKVNCF